MTEPISKAAFAALRHRFRGDQTAEEAMATVTEAMRDSSLAPIIRLHAASAVMDLRLRVSVKTTMRKLRKATGLDPEKK